MTKMLQRHSANRIFHFGKTSVYFASRLNFLKFSWLPKYSYFDGGSYFKFSFYWLRGLMELSRPKKDNKSYQKVTYKEVDQILKKEFKKIKTAKRKKTK